MSDGRHIVNWKFAISQQPFVWWRRNFAGICRLGQQTIKKVKICTFPIFKLSYWKLNLRHISAIVQPIATKLCMNMQTVAVNRAIWGTAAILEIENSLYLCNCSSDHDEILHEHADWGRKQCGRLKIIVVFVLFWFVFTKCRVQSWLLWSSAKVVSVSCGRPQRKLCTVS